MKLGLSAGIQMIKDIHSDGAGDGEEKQTFKWNISNREWTTWWSVLGGCWKNFEQRFNIHLPRKRMEIWKLLKFVLKFAQIVPFRAGSYIALHPKYE